MSSKDAPQPLIGIAMGSESDLPILRPAMEVLQDVGVSFEARVLSAHRTPEAMLQYGHNARMRGLRVIIAGAGGAAHLPGMLASATTLPVIGVPVPLKVLDGMDSLLSIVQMPKGVPVATVGIGQGANAALLAVQILATSDENLAAQLARYKAELITRVHEMDARVIAAVGRE